MKTFVLEPEASCRLGRGTELDRSVNPPLIKKLRLDFPGWLGDDLLECFPAFVVSSRLGSAIKAAGFTGAEVKLDVPYDVDAQVPADDPVRAAGGWAQLEVTGSLGVDDFARYRDHRLAVTSAVFDMLRHFSIENCLVEEVDEGE